MYNNNRKGPRRDPSGTSKFIVATPVITIYGYVLITIRQIGFKRII